MQAGELIAQFLRKCVCVCACVSVCMCVCGGGGGGRGICVWFGVCVREYVCVWMALVENVK